MQRIKEELIQLEKYDQYRKIPSIQTKQDDLLVIDGKKYINFASNDYLGISTKDELREEFLSQNQSKTIKKSFCVRENSAFFLPQPYLPWR